ELILEGLNGSAAPELVPVDQRRGGRQHVVLDGCVHRRQVEERDRERSGRGERHHHAPPKAERYASTSLGAPTFSPRRSSSKRSRAVAPSSSARRPSARTPSSAWASDSALMSPAYAIVSEKRPWGCGSLWATTGAPADMLSTSFTKLASSLKAEAVSGATHTSAERTSDAISSPRPTPPNHG